MSIYQPAFFSLLNISIFIPSAGAQTYKFTTAGKVGALGPNQAELDSVYNTSGNPLNNSVISDSGIQIWEVPTSGLYNVTAVGGMAQNITSDTRSRGARIAGTFNLSQGDSLRILVGQAGNFFGSCGGTFVGDGSNNPVLVAGGGGTLKDPNFSNLDFDSHGTAELGLN